MPDSMAVRQQIRSSRSRSSSAGRPSTAAPSARSIFMPSVMMKELWAATRDNLPDPDDVWRAGGLTYSDYYALLRDGHASSCIDQRMSQTLSRSIRIELVDETGDAKSERALQVCRAMVDDWGYQGREQFLTNIQYAKFMGMQPFELNWHWNGDAEGNVVDVPQDLLQEWFSYTADGDLRIRRSMTSYLTDPVPAFKVLMSRNQPTLRNPYGRKLLSPCYWPITFKRGGLRFFAEYAERFGMPTIQIQCAGNDSDAKIQAFAARVLKMMRKGVVVSKPGFQVTHLDMDTKYQTTHLYDSFMNSMDREVSKALLGQTLTTEEGGSRAQGDIHKQILETLWRADEKFVAQELTALFEIVTFVNFGRGVKPPVAIVGEQLGLDRLDRDKTLRDFHGIEFSDEYFYTHYSLRKGDFKRVDPLKASYKDLPESNTAQGKGGSRPSEAAKTSAEKRDNHRNRNS